MRIAAVETRSVAVPLARPYTIAFRHIDRIELGLVVVRDDAGRVGLGTATPEAHVTGESYANCAAALHAERLQWLVGQDLRTLPALARTLAGRMAQTPAARAAVDMALHDLLARGLGLPLVDVLGCAHPDGLPTSITIGIKSVDEALREADEYVGRGFRILKVKLGRSFDEDVERLRRLRERVGTDVRLRADPNQGYDVAQTRRLLAEADRLAIEFLEQPVPVAASDELRALDEAERERLALDEAVLSAADAFRFAAPPRAAGIFNVKLMKCGGVRPALAIGAVAEAAGVLLMWGCMDESCVGIAAALHAALACPATRYLDLDGSFDLASDVARGGFAVGDGGVLRPLPAPGLGADLV